MCTVQYTNTEQCVCSEHQHWTMCIYCTLTLNHVCNTLTLDQMYSTLTLNHVYSKITLNHVYSTHTEPSAQYTNIDPGVQYTNTFSRMSWTNSGKPISPLPSVSKVLTIWATSSRSSSWPSVRRKLASSEFAINQLIYHEKIVIWPKCRRSFM